MNTESLLKPQAAAEALNISKRTLYRMIQARSQACAKFEPEGTAAHG